MIARLHLVLLERVFEEELLRMEAAQPNSGVRPGEEEEEGGGNGRQEDKTVEVTINDK